MEYEINSDEQAIFNRTSKAERLRWRMEQLSASKRRKLDTEVTQDHYSRSDDDDISTHGSDEELNKVNINDNNNNNNNNNIKKSINYAD